MALLAIAVIAMSGAGGTLRAQPSAIDTSQVRSAEATADATTADTTTADTTTVDGTSGLRRDSVSVRSRRPSEARLDSLRDDKAFDYGRHAHETRSLWDLILGRVIEWFKTTTVGSVVGDVIVYGVLPLIVIIALLRVMGADVGALLRRRSRRLAVQMETDEDVHHIDYDARIAAAVDAGDLREAIRLHYLRTLRDLSAAGLIEWSRRKTNHDYLLELAGTAIESPFARATLVYEFVWYGDFAIDAAGYERIRATFERLIEQITVAR